MNELDFFGLSDITYHPTGGDTKNLKVTGRHKDLTSTTESFGLDIYDGHLVLDMGSEMIFESKLSSKTTNQTELSTKSDSNLVVVDGRYAEDCWRISAKASEFITDDEAHSVIPVSDMDLMVRIDGQADQSLITNGGISIENTTDKATVYMLGDKESELSMYLTTKKVNDGLR